MRAAEMSFLCRPESSNIWIELRVELLLLLMLTGFAQHLIRIHLDTSSQSGERDQNTLEGFYFSPGLQEEKEILSWGGTSTQTGLLPPSDLVWQKKMDARWMDGVFSTQKSSKHWTHGGLFICVRLNALTVFGFTSCSGLGCVPAAIRPHWGSL